MQVQGEKQAPLPDWENQSFPPNCPPYATGTSFLKYKTVCANSPPNVFYNTVQSTVAFSHLYMNRYLSGWASQMAVVVKDPPAYEGDSRDMVGKIPWRRRRTWRLFPGRLREAEQFAPGGLGRCVCVCEVLSHAQLLEIVLDSPVNEIGRASCRERV